MKTKPTIVILLLIIFPFVLAGQSVNDYCGVGDYPYPNVAGVYNQSIDPGYLASISPPVVYNISFGVLMMITEIALILLQRIRL